MDNNKENQCEVKSGKRISQNHHLYKQIYIGSLVKRRETRSHTTYLIILNTELELCKQHEWIISLPLIIEFEASIALYSCSIPSHDPLLEQA